jgi:hypothetical protein
MGAGPKEKTMRLKVLGAASIAAIAMVACAKKDETKAADAAAEAVAVETTEAAPAEVAVAPDATDVYAAPTIDIASARTKDALTSAADAAFAQADTDANGSLSQTEFYSLAALLTPAATAETSVDAAVDATVEAAAEVAVDATGAVVGEVAGAPAGDAAAEAVAGIVGEEPAVDAGALDASFATIAGADASLSTDDLRAALLSRFDAADVNLDGSLDEAESETFKAAKLF